MSEEMRAEFKYLMLLGMIRRLAAKGNVDIHILERLNEKNAESLNCVPLPLA